MPRENVFMCIKNGLRNNSTTTLRASNVIRALTVYWVNVAHIVTPLDLRRNIRNIAAANMGFLWLKLPTPVGIAHEHRSHPCKVR